jgi:hypothetical protein
MKGQTYEVFLCVCVYAVGDVIYLVNKTLITTRPDFSSERAPHRDNTATFRQNVTSGHGFQSELDTTTY